MKILHTSDWHLGRTLYSRKDRQEEHSLFLDWLLKTIKEQAVDVLLIVGDVFDTSTPGISSQKMYYDFLINVRNSGCRHVIVVGGNHDSPSFLNAPKVVLAALDVVVVGNATENIENEILVLNDEHGASALIVCAVPFLRERDISRFAEGMSYSDRSVKINESIRKHYQEIAELAEKKRQELQADIPIVATGHLSVMGGKRSDDDGVRDTYIGNIAGVGNDIFPTVFDYVALGHYHIPSVIKEHIRYCGSPIPMGFGEVGQEKKVFIGEFGSEPTITPVDVPLFQRLESIRGDKQQIESRLNELKKLDESVWTEVVYDGRDIFPDFSTWVNELVENTKIEVLRLQNKPHLEQLLTTEDHAESLDTLNETEVFEKLLGKNDFTEESKTMLRGLYQQILNEINDTN